MACLDISTYTRLTIDMITIDLLDTRYVELTDELKRVEGAIRENRQMREWLAQQPKDDVKSKKSLK